MAPSLRLCLCLHNHQPVGNFHEVFEQAYQDSYLPFLDVFESYPDLRIALHTSGPLMEWLDEQHGNYLDRLAGLVAAGRVEIVGGAFYEAILTMIPSRDRVGQILDFTEWLENRLDAQVQGAWIPERVWEQSLTSDLVAAGVRYIVLDDFHFRNAGLDNDELHGYYLTEDDGRVLSVFPGSERLRYTIPFAPPQETIDYLRGIAQRHPGAVVVFGDDGEKFGTWPQTKQHVYDNGWLRHFFDALRANRDWLQVTTLAEAIDHTPPVGKVYLPDGSYREMTEWALPVARQHQYEDVVHDLEHDARWPRVQRFVRGGAWRNFKVKYPETNEMYARMMQVSRRLEQAERAGHTSDDLRPARRELYRGQCNCGYWHGAFGGIYLPHLRGAVFNHLIAADNLLDRAIDKPAPWIEGTIDDFNFDLHQEVRLATEKLACYLAPAAGGRMYELDVRTICHNLLSTIDRRPEAYHRKVLGGAKQGGEVASIHDRVVFKQEGLDKQIVYDKLPRKSLIDHFFDEQVSLESLARGEAEDRGDFAAGPFDARLQRNPDRIRVVMSRVGLVSGQPVKITKGVTLASGASMLEIAYRLEGLPRDRALHFAVEFNFAGMPSNAWGRYFYVGNRESLGSLGNRLDLKEVHGIGLVDEWLGLDVHLGVNRTTNLWTFPVETVSQSEGGFELVHQSVVVMPHWQVRADAEGRWGVTLHLTCDTSLAESRQEQEHSLAGV